MTLLLLSLYKVHRIFCVCCCCICIIFIISWFHSSALLSERLLSFLSTQLLSLQFKFLIFSLPILFFKKWTSSEPLLLHFYLHNNLPSSIEFPSNFLGMKVTYIQLLLWCNLQHLVGFNTIVYTCLCYNIYSCIYTYLYFSLYYHT